MEYNDGTAPPSELLAGAAGCALAIFVQSKAEFALAR
jgi:hypothetical protein